jgi:hypothetical protein
MLEAAAVAATQILEALEEPAVAALAALAVHPVMMERLEQQILAAAEVAQAIAGALQVQAVRA